MSGLCADGGGPDYRTLEARIDELEALVVKVEQQRNTMTAERDDLMADNKKLEAHLHIVTGERNRYLDRHEDAEAENERLRDARASDALFAEKKVNQAEAERDKWEWVARDIAGAFPEAAAILVDAISRWQPGAKP